MFLGQYRGACCLTIDNPVFVVKLKFLRIKSQLININELCG